MRRIAALVSMCMGGLACVGCATRPAFDLGGVDATLTPTTAAADIDAARAHQVEWGGVIISARNLRDHTEIEVLAYPLDRSARPELGKTALGRFMLTRPGYLETVDYSPGRLITAVGPVTGIHDGTVGKSPYRFAVMAATELHLWPKWTPRNNEPRITFGFGLSYSN
ncbi:MAG: Slp family lipoprotein [Acidiferrobacterales bacterium]